MLREGYLHAQKMLRLGLIKFEGILPDLEVDKDDSDDDDEAGNDDDLVDEAENESDDDPNELFETNRQEGGDDDEDEIEEVTLELVLSTGNELADGKSCTADGNNFFFPSDLCQARLNGRNGSSACTTISLLVGYFLPRVLTKGQTAILECFVGCIEFGNYIHGDQADTTVEESLKLKNLPEMSVTNLDNTFFTNLFERLSGFQSRFIVVTGNGKSMCCVPHDGYFVFFDSHSHGDYGALVSVVTKQDDLSSLNFENEHYLDLNFVTY